ncbi:MAG: glutamate--tRNA ligase, partial [Deltaproteobacteria bacterium]
DLKGAAVFDQNELEKIFSAFLEKHQIKLGKVAQPLRVILTGKRISPGIFEVMEVLGQETVIRRLSHGISYMKGKKNT